MATPRRLDDAPLDKRIRGAQVGCAVGALVAFPFLPAGLEPMSLAVPVGLVTGFWLAPAVHADGKDTQVSKIEDSTGCIPRSTRSNPI